MKKKMLTLMAFVMLTITATFANGNDISKNVLASFTTSFSKATNVKWEKNNAWYNASFQMDGKSLNALFSREGEMIAISENILSTGLPVELQASLPTGISAFWITDLVKYSIGEEIKYYVTIENADEKITLENIGQYEWSVLKKTDK